MREVLRTNDPVLLSWAAAILRGDGFEPVVFDIHASTIEGSIGALQRRLMVADEDYAAARHLIDDARAALDGG